MKKVTRFKYNQFLQQVARLNHLDNKDDINTKFTVEPSIAQKLETKQQENSVFLSKINVWVVDEKEGEKVGLSIDRPIASTTDTSQKEREASDPSGLDGRKYNCKQTNFDTALPYIKLDMWAKFPDFQIRIRNAIVKRQALDRIMIGFNGTHRAKTSDHTVNKLLQDVNRGWLQGIRDDAASQVMDKVVDEQGDVISAKIRVGKGGDFHNLDALVMAATDELIEPWFQEDTELVAIVGRQLLADKYFPIVNQEQPNSEALAADLIISQKRVGGLPAVRAPSFPPNAVFITRLDNLSIYWQDGTRRRHIIDNPKRDRIENYESVNEDYVVEDFGCVALIENIEFGDFSAPAEG
ncbi:phage major capsid protein, P2 family [Yersinia aleksiciae]|uniref:Capsid protein n=1 Tax=Yersinia aleksiciae TaxID=263819 RepID=A0ABN4H223_YERAE|nr:phage major capsid protein, P2 family [Yersinia aleksiciae]AKP32153.1 capsid protein [Yersinia aleksiciae]CFQ34381.1 major capsid protein [Yersinia aleksiciae]